MRRPVDMPASAVDAHVCAEQLLDAVRQCEKRVWSYEAVGRGAKSKGRERPCLTAFRSSTPAAFRCLGALVHAALKPLVDQVDEVVEVDLTITIEVLAERAAAGDLGDDQMILRLADLVRFGRTRAAVA